LDRPRRDRAQSSADHGVFNVQDTDAEGYTLPGPPQHVYTVRFTARELWGDAAHARVTVHVELWEGYLERA
jgi:nitrile hydratase